MKQSTLLSILTATKQINWSSKSVENKALMCVSAIFNQITRKGNDFNEFEFLSQQYFKQVAPGKTDHITEIKSKLVSNNILMCNEKYNVFTGIGKGYQFNSSLLSIIHHSHCYHNCLPLFESIDIQPLINNNKITKYFHKKRKTRKII